MLGPATELVYETPCALSLDGGRRAPTARCSSAPATKGKVFQIDARRQGLAVLRCAELEVARARAWRPDGGLYVGTSPDGKIYKVDRDGTGERRSSIPKTSTSGRWPSMPKATCMRRPARRASSTRSRRTARARLLPARRRRMPPRSPSTRAATCSSAPSRPAASSAIDADGKAFVLLDSPFQEIRALRFDDKGALYVGGAERPRETVGRDRRPRPTSTRAADAGSRARAGAVGVGRRSRRSSVVDVVRWRGLDRLDARAIAGAPKGAVYRIAPDGLWDQLWESRDDSPYDLAFDARAAR